MKKQTALLIPFFFAIACTSQFSSEQDFSERGPIGKADALEASDNIGSCETTCDGPAPIGNCWCDESCEAYGDCCSDKVAICDAPPARDFASFEFSSRGFCVPSKDCVAGIVLQADGALSVDNFGEPNADLHTAVLSEADLIATVAVLTAPELLEVLDTPQACRTPTDLFETMILQDSQGTHRNTVTNCNSAAVDAARDILETMAAKYMTE